MCTFKAGDVVRILGGTTSIPEIAETIGKTGVIIDISRDVAKVSFVSDFWYYNFDEIEHYAKDEPLNIGEQMLKKVGVSIHSKNGEFRSFVDIIDEISRLPDDI